jgi:hypothetical protein
MIKKVSDNLGGDVGDVGDVELAVRNKLAQPQGTAHSTFICSYQ